MKRMQFIINIQKIQQDITKSHNMKQIKPLKLNIPK